MKKLMVVGLVLLAPSVAMAHPHFQKTTSATLPGDVEVSISFFTVPANESHAAKTANGDFVSPGLPKVETSVDVKAGSVTIPAGTYTLGAIKNGADDWTMALSPGELGFGDKPDMSKLIKLDSEYVKSPASTGHLVVDLNPGDGKFEGKSVITLGFGSMWLSGVLADAAE